VICLSSLFLPVQVAVPPVAPVSARRGNVRYCRRTAIGQPSSLPARNRPGSPALHLCAVPTPVVTEVPKLDAVDTPVDGDPGLGVLHLASPALENIMAIAGDVMPYLEHSSIHEYLISEHIACKNRYQLPITSRIAPVGWTVSNRPRGEGRVAAVWGVLPLGARASRPHLVQTAFLVAKSGNWLGRSSQRIDFQFSLTCTRWLFSSNTSSLHLQITPPTGLVTLYFESTENQ